MILLTASSAFLLVALVRLTNCDSSVKIPLTEWTAAIEIYEVNYRTWHHQLQGYLHEQQTKLNNSITHVAMTITDMAYVEAFQNWQYMVTNGGNNHTLPIFIGSNQPTCDYLQSKKFHYFCFQTTEEEKIGLEGYIKSDFVVGFTKLFGPLLVLKQNLTLIFSEMDVFWAKSPLIDLDSEENMQYDIQCSPHVNIFEDNPKAQTALKELNIGFFYVRPTLSGVALFQEMLNYSLANQGHMSWKTTYDQKVFDHFIRRNRSSGEEPPQWGHLFDKDFVTKGAYPLSWRRLPGDLYTHNLDKKIRFSNDTITMHISFGIKQPSYRVYCAYKLGLIAHANHSGYVVQEKYHNYPCFVCCNYESETALRRL